MEEPILRTFLEAKAMTEEFAKTSKPGDSLKIFMRDNGPLAEYIWWLDSDEGREILWSNNLWYCYLNDPCFLRGVVLLQCQNKR